MTAQLFAAPFLSVASLAESFLLLRSFRSGAQKIARRSFHFPTAPLMVRFLFFLPLKFRQSFFLCVSKIFSIRRQAKNFFACRRFPMKILREAVRANFMRGLPPVSVSRKSLSSSKIHLNCKLFSRSHHLRSAAGLSCQNIVRSKKFCSVRHFHLHTKAAARYPRGCRFFTSFYAPLSGNNIHIHHAP